MTPDPTLVALLDAIRGGDAASIPVLCDRLEELADPRLADVRSLRIEEDEPGLIEGAIYLNGANPSGGIGWRYRAPFWYGRPFDFLPSRTGALLNAQGEL